MQLGGGILAITAVPLFKLMQESSHSQFFGNSVFENIQKLSKEWQSRSLFLVSLKHTPSLFSLELPKAFSH